MRKNKVFDELLVLQYQQGNKQAFELLFKRWNKKLVSFAYKLTHDTDSAKDVVQDSWISIQKGIYKLKSPSKLSSWMFRVTYNKSIDYLRKKGKHEQTELTSDISEAHEESEERWLGVEQILKRLPADQKVILTLFYLEEHSVKEIAEILDLKEATVKSRIFYAREKLKKKYKEVYHEK